MHQWCALSVFFCDGKFLFEEVGFGACAIIFLKIRLEIVLLHMHGVHCLFSYVMENPCFRQVDFELVQFFFEN